MCKRFQIVSLLWLIGFLVHLPAKAQVGVGDNVKLNLAGDISAGYNGGFGETGPSSHSLNFGGNGTLHGFYYNPRFVSFDFQPYYNRSQANSSYQSITNSSGFNGTVNFFNGSHFPGSVSWGQNYDSSGEFGIPGVTGVTTTGSGRTFAATWAALMPGLPTLNVSYTRTRENNSVPGANADNHLGSGNLNIISDYLLRGFHLHAFYNRLTNNSEFPAFLSNGSLTATSGANSYGVMASHKIIMHGYWSTGITRSSYNGDYGSGTGRGSSSGNSETVNTNVSVSPLTNLNVGLSTNYQTNVFAAAQQEILQAGGAVPRLISENSGSELSLNGNATYTLTHHILLNGQWSHHEQYFTGGSRGVTQYGGGVALNYANRLLGAISFAVGANDTATQNGNTGAGLYGNANFFRKVRGWELGSNFNYLQSIQTLIHVYTSSTYGYGGNARRRFGEDLYLGLIFNGSHSGLVQVPGSSSHAESWSANVTYRRYNLVGLYSQSGGVSVLTAQGLIAVPTGIPSPILKDTMLYNARSYGGGFSATLRRFVLNVNYSRASSTMFSTANSAANGSTLINARLRYRVRKMYFDSGFTKFRQAIGTAGSQPTVINSYYFGISRWFNVF